MFSWRAHRQLVVFLIVISPLIAAGIFVVQYAIPTASCFDNKQNQHELGIDCGGECFSCELKFPQSIKVFWSRAVPVRKDSYDVAAEIENRNERVSSVDAEYEFTLYDEFGPITKRTGKTFLYAQERTLVIEPNIETPRAANRAEFRIVHVEWQEKKDLAPTIIAERRQYNLVDDHGKKHSEVGITLFNSSPYDFASVEVQVAVIDKDQNLLGVNKIIVENLRSQSRQDIKSIWPQQFAGEVSVINVQPRVNIFDERSILKPQ